MNKDKFVAGRFGLALWVLLLVIVLTRLSLLGTYPLLGTTEPRYAELARKMFASGDWVTLWVSDGVPLWGKPPLLFWAETLAMTWLGMSEFALRLPTYLTSLVLIALFWFWPTDAKNSTYKNTMALLAAIVYFSTPFGFFAAGFVATDIFLTLGLTLSMVGFWIAMNTEVEGKKTSLWHWAFFVGMAIGLLAKGPLALVLLGLALFVWMLGSPKERLLLIWQKLPWVRGLLLMALIAFPWYILAEIRTPGFLRHFIIGEHIERFFVKDWAGGRFAPSHGEPLGMIWWFAIQSFMPWLLLTLPALLITWRVKACSKIKTLSSETLYLLGWIAAPLILFTPSSNILEAYMLTAVPAFALLMAQLITWLIARSKTWHLSMLLALLVPLAVVISVIFFYPVLDTQSQRHLLRNWESGTPLYYVGGVPPSAIFYSANEAKSIENESLLDDLNRLAENVKPPLVVLLETNYLALSDKQKSRWEKVETYREYTMLRQSRP